MSDDPSPLNVVLLQEVSDVIYTKYAEDSTTLIDFNLRAVKQAETNQTVGIVLSFKQAAKFTLFSSRKFFILYANMLL